MKRSLTALIGCAFALLIIWGLRMTTFGHAIELRIRGKKTVQDRLQQYGAISDTRWRQRFDAAGITYPPERILFVGIKKDRMLQVYATDAAHPWCPIVTFRIRGMSGQLGPKLREGDNQVPEGLYRIESLNPNSLYHLSLRLDYPNDFDRTKARLDGRSALGGDIMIHGKSASIGCLAMGDEAAEDLFVLTARVGRQNANVLLIPVDFRHEERPRREDLPSWTTELYKSLQDQLLAIPSPTNAPTVRRTRVTATAYALAAPRVPVRFAAGEA